MRRNKYVTTDQSNLPNKLLFVDDDPSVGEGVANALRKYGIIVVKAHDFDTAMYQFNQQIFEVAIVELEFSTLPGLAVVQKFRAHANKERRATGIIIASGQQRKGTDEALGGELGDMEFIQKPLNEGKLLSALAKALLHKRHVMDYEVARELAYDLWNKHKNLDGAIAVLKQTIPRLGRKSMSLMAGLYEEATKNGESLQIVDALLQQTPDDIALINAKGRLLLKMGRTADARAYLERADTMAPKNIERIRAMAELYLKMENPDASVGKMKELIALNPESKDIALDCVRSLDDAGYIEQAVSLCRETTLPTEVIRYYNNRGVALSKSAEHEAAVNEYLAALKFYPDFRDNYRIHFNVAIAEVNQKSVEHLKRAQAALQRCLALAPEFEKARLLLNTVHKALEGVSEAA